MRSTKDQRFEIDRLAVPQHSKPMVARVATETQIVLPLWVAVDNSQPPMVLWEEERAVEDGRSRKVVNGDGLLLSFIRLGNGKPDLEEISLFVHRYGPLSIFPRSALFSEFEEAVEWYWRFSKRVGAILKANVTHRVENRPLQPDEWACVITGSSSSERGQVLGIPKGEAGIQFQRRTIENIVNAWLVHVAAIPRLSFSGGAAYFGLTIGSRECELAWDWSEAHFHELITPPPGPLPPIASTFPSPLSAALALQLAYALVHHQDTSFCRLKTCGKPYEFRGRNQRYCSPECSTQAQRESRTKYNKKVRSTGA